MQARAQNALIISITPLAIVAYTPILFYRPRLMCEEAVVYLASAWQSGFFAELVRPHLGYYYLLMNLCSMIGAHWLPLAWTAAFFTIVALLVQVLTVYTLLQCEAFASLSFGARCIGAFIVLFATPNLEAWVSLINSQFLFLVIGGLLFLSDPARRVVERTLLLAFAGLSGPLTICLTPFFWIRAWRSKSRAALAQAIVLTIALAVQSVFILRALTSGERAAHRQWSMAGGVLLVRNLVMPFFSRLAAKAPSLLLLHHPGAAMFALASVAAAIGFAALLWLLWESVPSRWLVAFALVAALFCIAGALNPTVELLETGMAPRYSFASNVFLGLAVLLAFGCAQLHTARRTVLAVLLACFVVSSVFDSGYYRFYKAPPGGAPSWTAGIRAWEQDPSTPIKVGGTCTPLTLTPRR